ncbi:MAG TPA: CBS domain-containing protein [Actinomycetota bacterium]|jgi:CBS domain-containing protein|nr:CBS domain-containing protein [Actinomycetota bacterium]
MTERRVPISDVVLARRRLESSADTLSWLAELLRHEGVDLMEAPETELTRGTPVYVDADADALEVQRRMARSHIRRLPVVKDDQLVGIVDLLDLAESEHLSTDDRPQSLAEAEPTVLPPLEQD